MWRRNHVRSSQQKHLRFWGQHHQWKELPCWVLWTCTTPLIDSFDGRAKSYLHVPVYWRIAASIMVTRICRQRMLAKALSRMSFHDACLPASDTLPRSKAHRSVNEYSLESKWVLVAGIQCIRYTLSILQILSSDKQELNLADGQVMLIP